MQTFKEIARTALQIEQEGARFYRDVAQKTKHPLVKATFEFLAQEEDRHILCSKSIWKNRLSLLNMTI